MSLADRLRTETRALHTQAERSGIMRALLRGELSLAGYCALLRNLYVIYAALEPALLRHAQHPLIAPIHDPVLFRRAALAADLDVLHGPDWSGAVQVTETSEEYSRRLEQHAKSDPAILLAHAYLRYLGDLSGGQILQGIVRASMKLPDEDGSRFYQFGGPGARALAQQFRAGLDAITIDKETADRIVGEAQWAFWMHARLFDELAQDTQLQSQPQSRLRP
ncbi:MAG: biliverdin-producing heme oxygenase [Panacagrimonas sp.]